MYTLIHAYSTCHMDSLQTHRLHACRHPLNTQKTYTQICANPCTSTSWIHTVAHKHPIALTNTHTHSLSLFPLCVFHRFSCHLVRVRHPDCSSCSQKGGKHVLLCVTPPLFPPGLNFKSNAPPFSTSVPSPLPHRPLHLLFLRYDPFQLLSSVRLPLQLPSLPSPPSPPFFLRCLSPFLSLYKVFQIYHLYIMMYGYDNVLYYGKMRKIYFCYRFVS